jgi:hypothetical protein
MFFRSFAKDIGAALAAQTWITGFVACWASATSETMMATRMPLSVPMTITPTNAASAQRNSVRRMARILRNSAGWMSPTEYTMTMPASTACGIRPNKGARSSMVSSVMAAVTSPETWVRAPTMRFTAVWLMPPPAGIDPNNAPAAFAAPVASSSVLGRGGGSPARRTRGPRLRFR